MRVISGSARGRKLFTPPGMQTRPTTDRVKESIFNIIQMNVSDAAVLDLFCGSGQMGIEALSRGARSCLFTDSDARAVETAKKNVELCSFGSKAQVLRQEMSRTISGCGAGSVDLIFLDPPYGGAQLREALALIFQFDILSADGIIVCESSRADEIGDIPPPFAVRRRYQYGRVAVTTIVRE